MILPLPIGTRIRLSLIGLIFFQGRVNRYRFISPESWKERRGVIARKAKITTGVVVLWDGKRTTDMLHHSHVEEVPEGQQ